MTDATATADTAEVICAHCTDPVPLADTCESCGEPPALDGRYRFQEIVGRGSFGITYRAGRLDDGDTVAVKEMLLRQADTTKSVELFEREAEVLEQLDHPGIPHYLDDLWHRDGRSTAFFLVQEFIDGVVVEDELGGRPNHPERVFEILEEVLEILVYLHEFSPPVVHRDVKPANLMLRNDDDAVVLVDFGSVQAALMPEEGGSTVAGTFGYMAPEQLSGRAEPKSDIYGAAATAVALLSGRSPDTAPGETFDLSSLNIDDRHRRLLEWMLAAAPERRPTAKEAVESLGTLHDSSGDSSPEPSVPLETAGRRDLPAKSVDLSLAKRVLGSTPRKCPQNFEYEYISAAENNYSEEEDTNKTSKFTFNSFIIFGFGAFAYAMCAIHILEDLARIIHREGLFLNEKNG